MSDEEMCACVRRVRSADRIFVDVMTHHVSRMNEEYSFQLFVVVSDTCSV